MPQQQQEDEDDRRLFNVIKHLVWPLSIFLKRCLWSYIQAGKYWICDTQPNYCLSQMSVLITSVLPQTLMRFHKGLDEGSVQTVLTSGSRKSRWLLLGRQGLKWSKWSCKHYDSGRKKDKRWSILVFPLEVTVYVSLTLQLLLWQKKIQDRCSLLQICALVLKCLSLFPRVLLFSNTTLSQSLLLSSLIFLHPCP